jgi:predicted nucleotidyltransferase
MLRDDEKALLIRLLEALHPGVKSYLFGSRARGDNTERSDYDFALDTGVPLDFIEVARARNVLEAGLRVPWKIDVVDLNSVPDYLRNTILREGVLWKT